MKLSSYGKYERITLNGASTMNLHAGTAAAPALYEIQQIDLNGGSRIGVSGPVELRLKSSLNANGYIGHAAHPEWLVMSVSSGSFTLNSQSAFHGKAIVPGGTLTVNGGSLLHGRERRLRVLPNDRRGAHMSQPGNTIHSPCGSAAPQPARPARGGNPSLRMRAPSSDRSGVFTGRPVF